MPTRPTRVLEHYIASVAAPGFLGGLWSFPLIIGAHVGWHGSIPSRPSQLSVQQSQRWEIQRLKVGARIRELRLAQNLSQEALAPESGLSRNMLIGIEWGRKSVAYKRLWDVADVLGVPVNQPLC